jgi:hypothetical protein
VVIIVAAVLASQAGTHKVASPPTAASAPATATSPAPPPSSAPAPANSLSGPIGTTYQVTDDSGNEMTVKLTQVIDPAEGADQFTAPNNGFRFAGAVFTLQGVSGTFSDDANNNATVVGSNGQSYTADFDSIAGYTNFNNGEFNLTPGVKSVGAVTFQIPNGVMIASIQWNGNIFGGAPATWVVTDAARSSAFGAVTGPWAVVSAYYRDVTMRRYRAAWGLLGFSPQGGGYASFVAGYALKNGPCPAIPRLARPRDRLPGGHPLAEFFYSIPALSPASQQLTALLRPADGGRTGQP